ncbi:MAG: hypothetical protein J6S85_17975 [Methanobrevibacter sp.]|nr:hypothetical protein [Methanobrevibacter sp.]
MLRTFPIDFIRQTFEQKLLQEHNKDLTLYGGKNQVNIFSFYEQLKTQEEVDRFVKNFRDLSEQQNKTGLILNGVLVSPENPSITNVYSSLIVPMTWTCSLRTLLENRDDSIVTINNLIKTLKGKKVDIAQLNCVDENGKKYAQPFIVGTIGQGDGEPYIKDGDYLGDITSLTELDDIVDDLKGSYGLKIENEYYRDMYCYVKYGNKLTVVKGEVQNDENDIMYDYNTPEVVDDRHVEVEIACTGIYPVSHIYQPIKTSFFVYGTNTSVIVDDIEGVITSSRNDERRTYITVLFTFPRDFQDYLPEGDEFTDVDLHDCKVYYERYAWSTLEDDGTNTNIIFPPEHTSFEKFKLSLSFDAIRCDEPRNLNSNEYCDLTFSGSATLVSDGVVLGNDLLKVAISKLYVKSSTDIEINSNYYWLEPMEMPSGNNANTQINQLISNRFISNTHTDALALSLQYSFILDRSNELIKQFWEYARFGFQADRNDLYSQRISPNVVYSIKEYWVSWGEVDMIPLKAKIVESIDIENTESDTLTITVPFQIQGDNN